MNILAIETSCDETAISVLKTEGDFPTATYAILGNALFSQIDIHKEYGGVFPAVAKREHAKTLVPMLEQALTQANLNANDLHLAPTAFDELETILEREPGLFDDFKKYIESHTRPDIDLIAVTAGPGLEPALWVGISFAKALALAWNIKVVGVNHMEGHVLASIFDGEHLARVAFPALALLISGGHTELIKISDWQKYEKIGQTRDDAVGEAFDKVARLLGLPYPGGPEISRLAAMAREAKLPTFSKLPRPMLDSQDLDFSFSGLKTAVRYAIEDKDLTPDEKKSVARDFEDAVTDVLLKKTEKAIADFGIKSLIIGGGVSANTFIRDTFANYFSINYPEVALYLPNPKLSTDNSIMISLAGHARAHLALPPQADSLLTLKADGNRSLSEESN